MIDPRHISIADFTYRLPENRIAKYPLEERDKSKLLVYESNRLQTSTYKNIADFIPENSLLIFNNTKVVEARLQFQKSTGGVIEIFCLAPDEQYADITTAFSQKTKVYWQCLIGGASKWKHGQILEKKIKNDDQHIQLTARFVAKKTSYFLIELSWTPALLSFAEILHHAGAVPLPPYIKRKAEDSDTERYQTVYAKWDGSVAAPTAGLHFTDHIFNVLKQKKIETDFATLHVGAGTFKPVNAEKMIDHEMHTEWMEVNKTTIENLLDNADKNIVAVGTTSLRTIESLYWLGVKMLAFPNQQSDNPPMLSQWEAYAFMKKNVSVQEALQALLYWMNENKLYKLIAKTQLLIAPGYPFKIVNGLITNFHQPGSTLLLLVAAFIGDDWKNVYQYALANDFRFLSYGDGCLLRRKN